MLLNFNSPIEAADGERRIVSGQIVPFGSVGNTSIGRVIFEAGSIQIPAPSKIKLLAQHNTNDPIGRAQSFRETATGIDGVFKLSAASKAQDYLVMASEGLIDGLSVGVEVLASRERKDGTVIVSAALLKEVSLVESPAFSEARVLEVVAQEGDEEVSAPIEVADETQTESEAAVSEDTTPATTEAAAAPAAEASRPTIKASTAYGDGSTRVRHGIDSMGRYTEHKIKAALGDDTSKLWVAASEDLTASETFTTNPAFNPIQYMKEFVSNTNFGRPAIDAVSRQALPSSGMSFNVPKLTVAPTVAAVSELGDPAGTSMESAYITGTVAKYAGSQVISLELLERSDPIFFDELAIQLQRAYLKATDTALITALKTGTVATGVAATSAGIISYVSTESAAAYNATSYFARNYIAGTGQWSLLMGAVDTTGRPIYNASNPMNNAGDSRPTTIKGNVLGLDLYVDHNAEATVIDDSAFIVAPECVTWYESPTSFFSVNVVSNMAVNTAIYGYGSALVKQAAGIRRFNLA
jgi:HK97 family phage prohead protease/HK97 family phage major capsid protein